VLTRSTAILAACFFATSLVLSMLAGWSRSPTSIIRSGAPITKGAPATPGGGVLDQLKQQEGAGAPTAPEAPATPQAPQAPQSK
jgi:preprotein translocase subunit SecG